MQAVIAIPEFSLPYSDTEIPLINAQLLGLTVLERAIRSLARADVHEILLLIPQAWETYARAYCRTTPLVVHMQTYTPAASQITVLKQARPFLAESFVWVQLDQVISPGLVTAVAASPYRHALLVDGHAKPLQLAKLTTPWLDELAHDTSETSLTHALEQSSNLQLLRIPEGAVHQSILGPLDLEAAKEKLLQALRKPLSRQADGLTAYFINRPLSLRMTRALINTSITPNQITTLALVLGLWASALVAQGSAFGFVFGGFLLQFSSILDGVDGELARLRLTASHAGEWFDTVCDDITNISFMLGLGVGCMRLTQQPVWAVLAVVAGAAGILLAGSMYRQLILRGLASHNHLTWGFEGEGGAKFPVWAQRVLTGFAYVAKRDTYTLLLMVLLLFVRPQVSLLIMVVGTFAVFSGYVIQTARAQFSVSSHAAGHSATVENEDVQGEA